MRSCWWLSVLCFGKFQQLSGFHAKELWHSMALLWSLSESWRASDSSILKPYFLASLRNLEVLLPVFFTQLCVILHDGGLRITGMAVDGLVNAAPIHWTSAAASAVNPLGLPTCYIPKCWFSIDLHYEMVSDAPEIPDNGSNKLLKWRHTLVDLLHYNVLDDSSTKENLRTPFLLHGEDEETCCKQTVSWNN